MRKKRAEQVEGTSDVSWTDRVQAITSVLTLLVTGFGFYFLYVQIEQTHQALNGSTHATLYAQAQAVNEVMIERPYLRKYIYENCELPEDPQQKNLVLAATDMFADFFEHVAQQHDNMPEKIWVPWLNYIRDVYATSPAYRQQFEQRAIWYEEGYRKLVRDKNAPNPSRKCEPDTELKNVISKANNKDT